MTKGWDEIEAAVYAVVLDVLAVEAALVPEVLLELLVNVVSHWLPATTGKHTGTFSLLGNSCTTHDTWLCNQSRVQRLYSCTHRFILTEDMLCSVNVWDVPFSVVHSIPKPRGVHNGELKFNTFLFYIHCVFGDFYCLCDSLWRTDTNRPLFLISAIIHRRTNIYHKARKKMASKAGAPSPSALSSFLSLYRSVRNRLLTRVDFPRPDSPSNRDKKSQIKSVFSNLQNKSGLKIKFLQRRTYLPPSVWSQILSWLTYDAPGLAMLRNRHIPCPGPKNTDKDKCAHACSLCRYNCKKGRKKDFNVMSKHMNTHKLISSFTKLPTSKHLNSQQLSESKIQWYHLRASNTNCSTWATPEAAQFSVTHWINQSEMLNTLQHKGWTKPHRSCLSPRFLGETLPRYLIIAVRVKSTPGALGPGGTDGGR